MSKPFYSILIPPNGYVGVPPDHPLHGQPYDRVLVNHFDITWTSDRLPENVFLLQASGYWWYGIENTGPRELTEFKRKLESLLS